MEPVLVVRERLPHHPLLGRNVNHDSRSRAFRLPPRTAEVALHEVRHPAFIPVLDQGAVGSCTGNAGVACVYRGPFTAGAVTTPWRYLASEPGAVQLYSDATHADPYQGDYPPDDTGSDGLSVGKVLKAAGVISGYLWAFTLGEAVGQLMSTPVITGVPWLRSMFETNPVGHVGHVVVDQRSGLAGGHELCVDEYIPAVGTSPAFVGGPNSWGTSWGDGGRWYLTVEEWGWLLGQNGDVTAFVPNTEPAPPPPAAPDDVLWVATREWSTGHHAGVNLKAALAVRRWAKATGRS